MGNRISHNQMGYPQNNYNPNMNKAQMNIPMKNYQNVSSPVRSHNSMNFGAQNFEQRMFPNQMSKPKFNHNINYGNPFGQNSVNPQQEFYSQQKKNVVDDPLDIEEIACMIYEQVEARFPEEAGKITGMIVDVGLDEMKHLIKHREKLEKVIMDAYEVKYY
jgi:hypothetical protein